MYNYTGDLRLHIKILSQDGVFIYTYHTLVGGSGTQLIIRNHDLQGSCTGRMYKNFTYFCLFNNI